MSQSEALVKLELLSNPLLNSGAREMLASVARRLGFGDEAAGHIALAIDEALCNIENHGYARDPGRPIWISVFAMGGLASNGADSSPTSALKIVIEDEAKQVDPATIRSRPLDEVRPGGLGVHIIRQVMDQVIYERRSGRGMRLTLVKFRPGSGPGSGAPSHAGGVPGSGPGSGPVSGPGSGPGSGPSSGPGSGAGSGPTIRPGNGQGSGAGGASQSGGSQSGGGQSGGGQSGGGQSDGGQIGGAHG